MTAPRPDDTNQPPRRGLIASFSGRRLLAALLAVLVVVVLLVSATTPLGRTGATPGLVDPRATAFLLSSPSSDGLRVGNVAPELTVARPDGSTYQLNDLDGRPIRLDALRGKVVWINFWATWCPPCQQETPILRSLAARYRDRGLELIGISVEETSIEDVAAYAKRYTLGYTIGFDEAGDLLRTYRVGALPTQVFIDVNGVINQILVGPVDEAGAAALIESMLGAVPSDPGPS